ncbi:hypothetical protein QR685DRAFT_571115 [Neurospora intermedia]|uniref:Uncharacterized protein n=1 Tax=Neurospora intermedia TaxID=5142 RepID=A0ABR3DIL8_NEUIN
MMFLSRQSPSSHWHQARGLRVIDHNRSTSRARSYIIHDTVFYPTLFAMALRKSDDDLFSSLISHYFIYTNTPLCPVHLEQSQDLPGRICALQLFYSTQNQPRTPEGVVFRQFQRLKDTILSAVTGTQRPGTYAQPGQPNWTHRVPSGWNRSRFNDSEYGQVGLDVVVSCPHAV